jgi:hypothetical protein
VSKLHALPQRSARPGSVRQQVNRRILRFSLSICAAASVLAAFLYVASVYPSLTHWQEINKGALAVIKCADSACDTTRFTTDWQLGQPDYVLDTQTRYFLNVPEPTTSGIPERFSPLDYSDVKFMARFRKATTYDAPDGEIWRLFSKQVSLANGRFEIIVGYAERAPWKMVELPDSLVPLVDNTLVHEVDKIAAALPTGKAILAGPRNAPSANADGFEVVDADTQQVLNWGPWLPIFLPKEVPLPSAGRQFYVENGDLYIVQTDTDGRLLATSLVLVGSLRWLGFVVAVTFVSTSLAARALSRRFLQRYFALMGVQVPTLAEALRSGEGQSVEFKRGLSTEETKISNAEDDILRSNRGIRQYKRRCDFRRG